MSGYTPESLRLRGLLDLTDVLEKPFTLAELSRRVRAKLDESPHSSAPAPS